MKVRTSARAPRLVVFDMDGVLIDHLSSWAAVHDALGTRNRRTVEAFMRGEIGDGEFIRRDVELWRRARPGFSEAELQAILAEIPRMPGLKTAIGELRGRGAACAIVSGGLRPLAEMLAREAPFDVVRANSVLFGPDGRLLDSCLVEVPLREKGRVVAALQETLGIPQGETAAVGDSAFDLGMFERAAVSVAFNPLDEEIVRRATFVVKEKDLRLVAARILEGLRVWR